MTCFFLATRKERPSPLARLEEQAVHEHEVADGRRADRAAARRDVTRGEQHERREARGEDGLLPKVERGERGGRAVLRLRVLLELRPRRGWCRAPCQTEGSCGRRR